MKQTNIIRGPAFTEYIARAANMSNVNKADMGSSDPDGNGISSAAGQASSTFVSR